MTETEKMIRPEDRGVWNIKDPYHPVWPDVNGNIRVDQGRISEMPKRVVDGSMVPNKHHPCG